LLKKKLSTGNSGELKETIDSIITEENVDFSNPHNKISKAEFKVVSQIKSIMGSEEGLTAVINNKNEVTNEVDNESIAKESTSYENAIVKLNDEIKDLEPRIMTYDVDKFVNTYNTLNSFLRSSINHGIVDGITVGFTVILNELYNKGKMANIHLNKPVPLNKIYHMENLNEEFGNTDTGVSNRKLMHYSNRPNAYVKKVFGNNVDLDIGTNTLVKRIKNMKDNENDKTFVEGVMENLSNTITELDQDINQLNDDEVPDNMDKVVAMSDLHNTYQEANKKMVEEDISNSNSISGDINVYEEGSRVNSIIKAAMNLNEIKTFKKVMKLFGDEEVFAKLYYGDEYDGDVVTALSKIDKEMETLKNELSTPEAKEILNKWETRVKLQNHKNLMNLGRISYVIVNIIPTNLIAKKLAKSLLTKNLSDSVFKTKSTNPIDRTPENYEKIKTYSKNIDHNENINIKNTESIDNFVYNTYINTLSTIKEITNDPKINLSNVGTPDNINFDTLINDDAYASEEGVGNYIRESIEKLNENDAQFIKGMIYGNLKSIESYIDYSLPTSSYGVINKKISIAKRLFNCIPDQESSSSVNGSNNFNDLRKKIDSLKSKNESLGNPDNGNTNNNNSCSKNRNKKGCKKK